MKTCLLQFLVLLSYATMYHSNAAPPDVLNQEVMELVKGHDYYGAIIKAKSLNANEDKAKIYSFLEETIHDSLYVTGYESKIIERGVGDTTTLSEIGLDGVKVVEKNKNHRSIMNEVLNYRLSRKLDLDLVPVVVHRDTDVASYYIEGAMRFDGSTSATSQMKIWGYLTAEADINSNNILHINSGDWEKYTVALIDHENSFDLSPMYEIGSIKKEDVRLFFGDVNSWSKFEQFAIDDSSAWMGDLESAVDENLSPGLLVRVKELRSKVITMMELEKQTPDTFFSELFVNARKSSQQARVTSQVADESNPFEGNISQFCYE